MNTHEFREISPKDWDCNPFERIGADWMLVTAGNADACNTMTASWGQMGVLWNKPVATCYLRPSRYTREFVEREGRYSLSFFAPGSRRNELTLLGTKSGRDGNKIAEAGLTPVLLDGVPAFAEANLVLVCRTLYKQDLLEECFMDAKVAQSNYPDKDYHRMYVGLIEKVYTI